MNDGPYKINPSRGGTLHDRSRLLKFIIVQKYNEGVAKMMQERQEEGSEAIQPNSFISYILILYGI
jgi:hypothetical protein